MKTVVIGSKNPAKVSAVKSAFKEVFPKTKFKFKSVAVNSGVSRQPLTEEETMQGAMNRVEGCEQMFPESDYWVGLESGVEPENRDYLLVEWVFVLNKKGELGKGRALSFLLPTKMSKDISDGFSIGDSNDKFFNKDNTGDGVGLVGTLTNEIITREKSSKDACIIALIRFINKRLY